MVPDLFTPSRFLCGIPQILLPLTFARNLMQLAPRAKGLRVLLSGLCSFPVACLFCSVYYSRVHVYNSTYTVCSGWLRCLVGSWCVIPCPRACSSPYVGISHLFHAPARFSRVSQRHSHGLPIKLTIAPVLI